MLGKSPTCSDRIRIDKLTSCAEGPKSPRRVSKKVPPEQSVINCHSERSRRIYVRLAVTLCPPTPTILRHCSGLQGALRVTVGLTRIPKASEPLPTTSGRRLPCTTSDHFRPLPSLRLGVPGVPSSLVPGASTTSDFRRPDGSRLVDAGVAFTPCP